MMLSIMLDGISIMNAYLEGIVIFFITVFGLGFFIIKHVTNDEVDSGIKLLASFSVGSIVLCIISYILILAAHFLPFLLRPGGFAVLFFGLTGHTFKSAGKSMLRAVVDKEIK